MKKIKHTHHTLSLQLRHRRAAPRSWTFAFPREEVVIRICGSAIALLIASYLILVAMTVFNAIARKESLDEMTRLRTSVGKLERGYFAISQQVTPAQSQSLGLTAESRTSYVYRPGAVGVASVRNEI